MVCTCVLFSAYGMYFMTHVPAYNALPALHVLTCMYFICCNALYVRSALHFFISFAYVLCAVCPVGMVFAWCDWHATYCIASVVCAQAVRAVCNEQAASRALHLLPKQSKAEGKLPCYGQASACISCSVHQILPSKCLF